ncbi:unnamed protein product, partial [Arctia plantaginis]
MAAAASKKSKKAKWIKASITDIIAEPTTIPTANTWADSVEEEPETFGYASRSRAVVTLPSASRAACGDLQWTMSPSLGDLLTQHTFLTYHMMLMKVLFLNYLQGLKGAASKGLVVLTSKRGEGLINAMNMPDLTINGRRIRIEVSTQDNDRRMGRGTVFDRE